jgi:hypothetical protein
VGVVTHYNQRRPHRALHLTPPRPASETPQADFRGSTGKGAAFIGAHVGVFHASRVDGVPYLINGNSAKTPGGEVTLGGFTGWSLLGVDPLRGNDWLAAKIRPHVDAIALRTPTTITTGETARVSATLRRGTRQVLVSYPVSHLWSGSPRPPACSPGSNPRRSPSP